MKKSLSVLALSLAAVFAGSAYAADTGFYAGGNAGVVNTNISGINQNQYMALSIVGGYQFNRYVAAEVQYSNLGSFQGVQAGGMTVTGNMSGFSTDIVGFLPIDDHFSLMGKLGVAQTFVNVSQSFSSSPGYSFPSKANLVSATYGVGIQYAENDHLMTRAGYEVYGIGDGVHLNRGNAGVFTVGEVYKF